MEPRIPYRGLFALPSTTALPLLLPDRCALAVPGALLKGKPGMDQCRPGGGGAVGTNREFRIFLKSQGLHRVQTTGLWGQTDPEVNPSCVSLGK